MPKKSFCEQSKVKRVLFYSPLRNFNQSMLQTLNENPKESYQLVEDGHPVPFESQFHILEQSLQFMNEIN